MKEKPLFEPLAAALAEKYGPVDMVSPWFPFEFTTYYDAEMGTPLFRRMIAFHPLIKPSELPRIKVDTHALESRHLREDRRQANVDPGYMAPERFVLATGKNFTHRIYLDMGVYADLTLVYTKGRFQKLPWTYPDYLEKNLLAFLERVRNKYMFDLRD